MLQMCSNGRTGFLKRTISFLTALTFCFTLICPPLVSAQVLPSLSLPGALVVASPGYVPTLIKGIRPDPVNPLQFSFLVDSGDSHLQGEDFNQESLRLIRYFLAALTVPEKDMWVNLSPYEKDRIIPTGFGSTEMGMDLLAQDYILKQLTASLMYPEKDLGKTFWDRVFKRAQEEFGTTNIPMDSFNKIWIIPKDAVVWEYDGAAYVVKSSLKVMLEKDYVALKENLHNADFDLHRLEQSQIDQISEVSEQIIREVLIPEIEKEVNEGENFSQLRQIYNSMILATWFKLNLKESLLGKVYVDQNKVKGVDVADASIKEQIYGAYLSAFQDGVYNYIKEDYDPLTQSVIPRRYFSGGFDAAQLETGVTGSRLKGDLNELPADQGRLIRQGLAAATPRGASSQQWVTALNVETKVGQGQAEEQTNGAVLLHDRNQALEVVLNSKIYDQIRDQKASLARREKENAAAIDIEARTKENEAINAARREVNAQEQELREIWRYAGLTMQPDDQRMQAFFEQHPEAAQMIGGAQYQGSARFSDPALEQFFQYASLTQKQLVTDETLEAFFPGLSPLAQGSAGKGGLGYLKGETYYAYRDVWQDGFAAMGVMPLYAYFQEGAVREKIDWENEKGIQRVMVKNAEGRDEKLTIPVDFNGRRYSVEVYWINANGTPVFMLYNAEIFERLYPDGDLQKKQYGFFGRAYAELMKNIRLRPDVAVLNEAQTLYVAVAAENDARFYQGLGTGEQSVHANTKFHFITHTPEKAALPVDDADYLRGLLGSDLVRDDMISTTPDGRRIIDAANVAAQRADGVTAVSDEHRKVTQEVVLPAYGWKTSGIQNGSFPDWWYGSKLAKLVTEKGLDKITGKDLFDAGQSAKQELQSWLLEQQINGKPYNTFSDLNRPMFGALRRLVEYKEQGMLLPMLRWITGDPEKEYETPLGRKKGLGANVLLGGPGRDDAGKYWSAEFEKLQNDPELGGKLVFVPETGVDIMRLAVSASDFWLVLPRPTREASGTSDERAGFNGHKVIATASGGVLAWMIHKVNGWLIYVFKDRKLADIMWGFENRNQQMIDEWHREGSRQLAQYMEEAVVEYNDYREGRDNRMLDGMLSSFRSSHANVNVHKMVREYARFFTSLINGTGAAGYEVGQVPASFFPSRIERVVGRVSERYNLNEKSTGVRSFLQGTGSMVDAINMVQEAGGGTFEDAQAIVVAGWVAAANAIPEEDIPVLAERLKEGGDFERELRYPERIRRNIKADATALQAVVSRERGLRSLDAVSRDRGRPLWDEVNAARQELSVVWKDLAQNHEMATNPATLMTPTDRVNIEEVFQAGVSYGPIDFAVRPSGLLQPDAGIFPVAKSQDGQGVEFLFSSLNMGVDTIRTVSVDELGVFMPRAVELVRAGRMEDFNALFFQFASGSSAVNSSVLQPDTGRREGEKVGGIDLNPAFLDLQIKRDGNGIPLPLPQQPIENMNIEGFVPIIINTVPVQTLPFLLGLREDGSEQGATHELSQMGFEKEEALVL